MKIEKINKENFNENSLLDFNRKQIVTETYRLSDNGLVITPNSFTDDWSLKRRKEIALEVMNDDHISYAFINDRVIGFISLSKLLRDGYMLLDLFHVDALHRHQGLGKKLFVKAIEVAKENNAKGLYISACSSKETIDTYLALGCSIATNPIKEISILEPYDIQLVYSF